MVPSAAILAPDGYLRVDYARLGLRLETWQDWLLLHGGGAPFATTMEHGDPYQFYH